MQVSTDLLDDTVLLSIHPGEVLPSSALPTPWFCWMWWRRLRGCSTGIHLFFRLNNFLIMVARFYALITLEEGEDIEMKVLPCSRISVTFLLPCMVSVAIFVFVFVLIYFLSKFIWSYSIFLFHCCEFFAQNSSTISTSMNVCMSQMCHPFGGKTKDCTEEKGGTMQPLPPV